jgi:hypothetical protein
MASKKIDCRRTRVSLHAMIRTTLAGEAIPAKGQKQKNEKAIVSGK